MSTAQHDVLRDQLESILDQAALDTVVYMLAEIAELRAERLQSRYPGFKYAPFYYACGGLFAFDQPSQCNEAAKAA